MKGKVTCPNCGHSWNKSDSSVKDMHVCHNCGKSDVNMKNGGWLDSYADGGTMQEHQENYNDSQAYAPQGMVGDGFSNVGRNYSPAWGGQFQNGGKAPIYVESKNDPRYKAYKDSLDLYNNYTDLVQNLNKQEYDKIVLKKGLMTDLFKSRSSVNHDDPKWKQENWERKKSNVEKKGLSKREGSLKSAPDFITGIINPTLPRQLYSDTINPTDLEWYELNPPGLFSDKPTPKYVNDKRVIANYSKVNPKQQVIVKPTTTKQTTKSKGFTDYDGRGGNWKDSNGIIWDDRFPDADNYKKKPIQQRDKIKPLQNNLHSESVVENNFNLEASVPTIRPQAKLAKYFDVTDSVNQNFGGSESHYKYYPENGPLQELAPEPYNSRKIVPHYQMGGNVYPVNYVPQAQMGMSIPGATGHMYARVGGAPSNGPYAKKTMASAQNGTEMRYYQNGLDWKPKGMKKGGIIKDDRGQWDHPGEITEIGSNNITMEGVPYPVLGVSDTGHTQMMYPGNDYKFKGKKVTEYPMAQNGINQADENSLVKLDQLTNFTNYNTKQPGGWLSKYS